MSQPLGRIINRFGKEIFSLDQSLPDAVQQYALTSFAVAGALIGIMFTTPVFVIAVPPLFYFYYRTTKYFLASARELKRLDSISRSPIFANFSETLNGKSALLSWPVSE